MDDTYDDVFQSTGTKYGIDPMLLKAQVMAESGGDPDAVGPDTNQGNAHGISQIMPATVKSLGVDPNNPAASIDAQARLLVENLKRFGTPEGAIAAYHGGTDTSNWGPKTQAYVQKITQNYQNLKKNTPGAVQVASASNLMPQDDFEREALGNLGAQSDDKKIVPQDDFEKEILAAQTAPQNVQKSTEQVQQPSDAAQTSSSSTQPATPLGTLDYLHELTNTAGNAATFGLGKKAAALGQVAANKLTGKDVDQDFSTQYQNALSGQNNELAQFKEQYPTSAAAANVIGSFGGTGIQAGAKLPATLIGKMAQGAGQGAVLGGIGGLGAANDQSFTGDVSSVAQGAKNSAIIGGLIPPVFAAGGAAVNALAGHGISPEVADLANTATEKYGIPLTGPQISNNRFVKYMDSMTGKLPFSGEGARAEAQSQAVTKAVGETIVPAISNPGGLAKFAKPEEINALQNATGLTPKYMSTARRVLGNMFNRVADNTTISTDSVNELGNKLASISQEAGQVLPDQEIKPLSNQINNILQKVRDDGTISGSTYQALTRKGAPLDAATSSSNPNIRQYAGQVRNALDDALEASASPEDLNVLQQARRGWKNLKTVQDVAAKAGIEGDISPNLLLNAVRKSYKNMAYSGAGDIGEIARITQLMKEAPSSGTAERMTAMNFLRSLGEIATGGGIGYGLGGSPITAAAGATGLIGAGKGVNALLNSDFYRNRLLQSAASGPGPISTFLNSPMATPATVIGVNRLQQSGQSQ